MQRSRWPIVVLVMEIIGGCQSPPEELDGGPDVSASDAGQDAGTLDGGTDGSSPDAGPPLDAGLDAPIDGATDAAIDSGMADAGPSPSVQLVSIGPLVSLATAECADTPGDCVLDVVATTDAESGSSASLEVVCGDASTTYDASVVSGEARFRDVTLRDGSTCSLVVTVTSPTRGSATAAHVPSLVFVDRTPPVLEVIAPVPGAVLTAGDDASLTLPGFQIEVRAETDDASEFVIDIESGCDVPFTTCNPPATASRGAPPVEVLVNLFITAPDERFRMTVRALDAVGNETRASIPFSLSL